MMTLKEMVRERKAVEPPREATFETAEAPVRALQIHAWNGEKWVLPWGYFYGAHLQGPSDREQVVLRFAHQEVVLDGVRLALLLPEIADFQVASLRDLPPKFQLDSGITHPFIARVSVRPARDSPKGGVETS